MFQFCLVYKLKIKADQILNQTIGVYMTPKNQLNYAHGYYPLFTEYFQLT